MIRRPLALLLAPSCIFFFLLAAPGVPPAGAAEIVKRVGSVTFRVDTTWAFPGGVVVVRLGSRGRLGSAWALLDGRRAPFYSERGVPRALVPVPVDAVPGPATLGVEIAGRRGEQRIPVGLEIAPRTYPARDVPLPEAKGALLSGGEVDHDARRLLACLRTESRTTPGPLFAPVVPAPAAGFGEARTYGGAGPVESRIDTVHGEYHRGIDYVVPSGTDVRAPGAATVLFAGPLGLSGETVVLDHGQGIVSVLMHLTRVDVGVGDAVARGARVGLSGETGLAPEPMLQWRVYLHGVAVDPAVIGLQLG